MFKKSIIGLILASTFTLSMPLKASSNYSDITSAVSEDIRESFRADFLTENANAYPFFRSLDGNMTWFPGINLPLTALAGYRFKVDELSQVDGSFIRNVYDNTVTDTTTLSKLKFSSIDDSKKFQTLTIYDPAGNVVGGEGTQSFNWPGQRYNTKASASNYPYKTVNIPDYTTLDLTVRPNDDFYRYANGKWLDNAAIPKDKNIIGAFYDQNDKTKITISKILSTLSRYSGLTPGSDSEKVTKLFQSFLDEDTQNNIGINAINSEIAKIDNINSAKELIKYFAYAESIGIQSPLDLQIIANPENTKVFGTLFYQSGLGLPSRGYYLNDLYKNEYNQYEKLISDAFSLAGMQDTNLKASEVLKLETLLAKAQMSQSDSSDVSKIFNKRTTSKLIHDYKNIDWSSYFDALGIPDLKNTILCMPAYTQVVDSLISSQKLDVWKSYFKWKLISAYMPYLGSDFNQLDFAFYGKTLRGQQVQSPIKKRAVDFINRAMPDAIGKAFVDLYFTQDDKDKINIIVKNVKNALRNEINGSTWLTQDTKLSAIKKLNNLDVKIGHPKKWDDYSALIIKDANLVDNMIHINKFQYQNEINDYNGIYTDRSRWLMPVQVVNAQAKDTKNDVTFPAAVLQPPFYSRWSKDVANYAGIGYVIGHEMSHQFDSDLSLFDENGNLRNWWSKKDRERYTQESDKIIQLFDTYSHKGINVNGKRVLSENIADLVGLKSAYNAYMDMVASKQTNPNKVENSKKFFLSFAQAIREKMTPNMMKRYLEIDSHAPFEFRARGTLSNMPAFYSTYGIQPGDKQFLPLDKRSQIW